jgi:predicted permease
MSVLNRVRNLFRDHRHSGEIAEELACHIDMRTEENISRGMSAAEARLEAERRFGNRTLMAERTRDFDTPHWLDLVGQNLRYSVRALRSSRGAAAVLVGSLALGIGANAAMFTLLNALLMRPLPVHDPASLHSVTLGNFCSWGWVDGDNVMNFALWTELQREQTVFTELFAYAPVTLDVSKGGGEVRLISGAYASSGMWSILGLRPVIGRTIAPADEKLGSASAVAVLGEAFWESEYGRDPGILGRTIIAQGRPFTVIGVAPRSFFGLYVGKRADVYLPLEASAWLEAPGNPLANGQRWWLTALGHLRPGVSPDVAGRQLAAISPAAMRRTIPPDWPKEAGAGSYLRQRFEVNPAGAGFSDVRQELRRPLLIASGLVGLLLLLACANIATLQLSRGLSRQREFAVRIALGASRARLGSQVFLESLLAASAGAALGVALSYPATRIMVALYSTALSSLQLDLQPDLRVLAFTAALAVVTALLFGLAPAVQAMRTAPHGTLKSVRTGGVFQPVFRWLLAVQVGLAVVLAVGALLFSGTLHRLTAQDVGFRTGNVLLMQLDTQRTGVRAGIDKQARAAFYRAMLQRLSALPVVESAGASYITPLSGRAWQTNLTVDGGGSARSAHSFIHVATPEYFRTYSTPVLAGRPLSTRDTVGSPQVVLVNRAFVRTVLAGGSFVGRRIRFAIGQSTKLNAEIAGVVADAKYRDLRSPVPPTVYVPMDQDPMPPETIAVALRTRGPVSDAVPSLRRMMAEINPTIAYTLRSFDSQVADSLVHERAIAAVSNLFGILALLLAGVGIYGLAAYSVIERRAEIGIRMAVGATAGRIVRLLFGQTGKAVAAGVLAGGLCAAWAARFTAALLFEVTPRSAWVYASAAAALVLVAAIAIAGPALRAARLDPVETLRTE